MGHCENYENRMDARYEKGGGVATTMLDLTKNIGAKQRISDIFKKKLGVFFRTTDYLLEEVENIGNRLCLSLGKDRPICLSIQAYLLDIEGKHSNVAKVGFYLMVGSDGNRGSRCSHQQDVTTTQGEILAHFCNDLIDMVQPLGCAA